jgi:hypothetical protein
MRGNLAAEEVGSAELRRGKRVDDADTAVALECAPQRDPLGAPALARHRERDDPLGAGNVDRLGQRGAPVSRVVPERKRSDRVVMALISVSPGPGPQLTQPVRMAAPDASRSLAGPF